MKGVASLRRDSVAVASPWKPDSLLNGRRIILNNSNPFLALKPIVSLVSLTIGNTGRHSTWRGISWHDGHSGSSALDDSRRVRVCQVLPDWKSRPASKYSTVSNHFVIRLLKIVNQCINCDVNIDTSILDGVFRLTGKVETLMCLILHSAVGAEDHDNLNFFRVAQRVLQSNVHRYYDCSARYLSHRIIVYSLRPWLTKRETHRLGWLIFIYGRNAGRFGDVWWSATPTESLVEFIKWWLLPSDWYSKRQPNLH